MGMLLDCGDVMSLVKWRREAPGSEGRVTTACGEWLRSVRQDFGRLTPAVERLSGFLGGIEEAHPTHDRIIKYLTDRKDPLSYAAGHPLPTADAHL
jgi:hypothetical protein